MRNFPVAGRRDVAPAEIETNADGNKTSRDAPAEVNGTLSLRKRFNYRRGGLMNDSHRRGYCVSEFVET